MVIRLLVAAWGIRTMSTRNFQTSKLYSDAEKIITTSISSVSPPELVYNALNFDVKSSILTVKNHNYRINHNVKVVAFGKAVLGMAAAVEHILGDHVIEAVASIPVGAMEVAQKFYPHHLPHLSSRIRVYEGAAGNLPDSASEVAAKEILSVASSCNEGDILLALISGGGSALLSYPIDGITIEEKRKVMETLSRGGASILQMNTVRKAISQTKGGKLAEAAYPAQVIALILSDVIGDPLEMIASGPTVPHVTDKKAVMDILEKFGLKEDKLVKDIEDNTRTCKAKENSLNIIIGNNKIATSAAKSVAIHLNYNCYVWSRQLQGEAHVLGEIYARITHYISLKQRISQDQAKLLMETLHKELMKLSCEHPELTTDILNLIKMMEKAEQRPFCLIGAGEPTVNVTGTGKGGRNQELVLAYMIKLKELREAHGPDIDSEDECLDCVFTSVGTDGQDGPCDAAGAVVDPTVFITAQDQGLHPMRSLSDNDSYGFFSTLNFGKNLIKTGLTGTNVMDIHILLMR